MKSITMTKVYMHKYINRTYTYVKLYEVTVQYLKLHSSVVESYGIHIYLYCIFKYFKAKVVYIEFLKFVYVLF